MLGFLIPLAILGLIAWGIVGVTRRGSDPFTLATATALYARVVMIAGVLMSLSGLGIILKAAFGFINLAYSYFQPVAYAGGYPPGVPVAPLTEQSNFLEQQRGQDLVLGITLLAIGVLVAGVHLVLGRAVARLLAGVDRARDAARPHGDDRRGGDTVGGHRPVRDAQLFHRRHVAAEPAAVGRAVGPGDRVRTCVDLPDDAAGRGPAPAPHGRDYPLTASGLPALLRLRLRL